MNKIRRSREISIVMGDEEAVLFSADSADISRLTEAVSRAVAGFFEEAGRREYKTNQDSKLQ